MEEPDNISQVLEELYTEINSLRKTDLEYYQAKNHLTADHHSIRVKELRRRLRRIDGTLLRLEAELDY